MKTIKTDIPVNFAEVIAKALACFTNIRDSSLNNMGFDEARNVLLYNYDKIIQQNIGNRDGIFRLTEQQVAYLAVLITNISIVFKYMEGLKIEEIEEVCDYLLSNLKEACGNENNC